MVSLLPNALATLGVSQPTATDQPKEWPLNTDKLRTSLTDAGFAAKIVARCDVPPVYEAAIFRWSENFEGLPALVVYPESEEEVSVVVKFAAANGITISLRCGGHNGAPLVQNSIVVDLGHFNSVSVNREKEEATFGGGCKWGEVYEAVNAQGLMAVGGGYHGVGVGGFLGGGGYSWLSGGKGMGCDQVLSARMCLADGSIVPVNAHENPDLFWGIRGGHGQFGVVLEYTIKVYPDGGQALVGMLGYRPDQLEEVLKMLHDDFFPVRTAQESLVLGFMRLPPHYQPMVAIMPWIQGDDAYIARIKSILTSKVQPIVDKTHVARTQVEVSHGADGLFAIPGARRRIDGLTTTANIWPEMVHQVWDKWFEFTHEVPDCRGSVVLFECHKQEAIAAQAKDGTAWAAREPHYYVVCTGSSMTSVTDAIAETFAIETAELIGSHHLAQTGTSARQWGTGRLNPATNEFTYTYATDRAGVKRLKERRDPEGVFQSPMGQQTHAKLLERNAKAV